jgi:hypothetical protein
MGDHKADPQPAGMDACRPRGAGSRKAAANPGPQPQVVLTVVGQVERRAAAEGCDVVPVPRQVRTAERVQSRFERREGVRGRFRGLVVPLNDDDAPIHNCPTPGFFPIVPAGRVIS